MKDAAFKAIFQERENVLELYKELHPEDAASAKDDVSIRTVGRVKDSGFSNCLGFSVGNRMIFLAESQGCSLKAFALRTLFYLAEAYQDRLADMGANVCDADDMEVPEWEAYMVCESGSKGRLSKLRFIPDSMEDDSAVEEIAIADEGLIGGYLEACRIIDATVPEERDGYVRGAALGAFEECRHRCGRAGALIWSKRLEVMGSYEQMFDEDEIMMMDRKASFEEGFAEGEESERRRIASRLLSSGMRSEDVARIVGASPDEIATMDEGVRSRRERIRQPSCEAGPCHLRYLGRVPLRPPVEVLPAGLHGLPEVLNEPQEVRFIPSLSFLRTWEPSKRTS